MNAITVQAFRGFSVAELRQIVKQLNRLIRERTTSPPSGEPPDPSFASSSAHAGRSPSPYPRRPL